jgi:predicted phage baseplate assembly protein
VASPSLRAIEIIGDVAVGGDTWGVELGLRFGPTTLWAGNAVAVDDIASLALLTPGADVARAHVRAARSGAGAGVRRPGAITVVVVPTRPDARGRFEPTDRMLRSVAEFLGDHAPFGARLEVAAPRFVEVAVSAVLVAEPNADKAQLASLAVHALDSLLHPIDGGPDGRGFPFGGMVRWGEVVARLAAISDVSAVRAVEIRVAGVPTGGCADAPLPDACLPIAGAHDVSTIDVFERAS